MTISMQKKHLKIDSSIYSPEILQKCLEVFRDHDIAFHEQEHILELSLDDEVNLEFMNLALSLTQEYQTHA